MVTTIDPSSGSRLAVYEETSDEQIDAILDRALRRYTDAVICRLRFRIDIPR